MKFSILTLSLMVLVGCTFPGVEKSRPAPAGTASAPVVATWFDNLDKAKAEAASSGRMIIVDFTAIWCGPCQQLKKEVFESDRFKASAGKYVFCAIDFDTNPELAKEFGITGIPDVRIFSKDGKELGKIVGYGGENAQEIFYSQLENISGG